MLPFVKTTKSECANNISGVCSSNQTVELIDEFIGSGNKPKHILLKAQKKLGCTSESCVLNNEKFKEFVARKGKKRVIEIDLSLRFKPPGPRNSLKLLNNINIDSVLSQWNTEFPNSYAYPFAMIDFPTHDYELGNVPVVSLINKYNCFYCVLNTDVSSGGGKHWVCVFVDCRDSNDWSVEYFNSTGNPPHRNVVRWMEKTRNDLEEYDSKKKVISIPVTDVEHQEFDTECGLYALFYIRSRLDGTPYQSFNETKIDDAKVSIFRKHVFRDV